MLRTEYFITTEPDHHRHQRSAHDLTDRRGEIGLAQDAVHQSEVVFVVFFESSVLPAFSGKCLEHAQSVDGFICCTHQFPEPFLCLSCGAFQAFSDPGDDQTHDGQADQNQQRQSAAHAHQDDKRTQDHEGLPENDLDEIHQGSFDFLQISCHSGDQISSAAVLKIAHGQAENVFVQFVADIPDDSVS